MDGPIAFLQVGETIYHGWAHEIFTTVYNKIGLGPNWCKPVTKPTTD